MDSAPDDEVLQLPKKIPISTPEGRTELSNARRFALVHRDKARYCSGLGWLCWDGKRWSRDDGAPEFLGKKIADIVWGLASSEEERRFASRTASAGGIRGMLHLAKSEPAMRISVDALGGDPLLLNCANGVVDLRTGELRPHRQGDWLTQLCPTAFEQYANRREWLDFLHSLFPGSAEIASYTNRLLGYCISGCVSEQILPIFFGDGCNGKSTLVNAVIDVLGPDYAMQAVPEMLLETKQTRHRTERADLFRKRLVSAAETGHGARLNESLVKQLTGGERIRANKMYRDNFEFAPTHKIILSTNSLPRIQGTDFGIWRRLQCVPFRRRFEGADVDRGLPDKLRDGAVGILSALVDGCMRWLANGLQPPEVVRRQSEAYRRDQNALERFVSERCVTHPNCRVKFSDLYATFRGFCAEDRSIVPTQKEVGAWLKERFDERRSNGVWYQGIALKAGKEDG